MTRREEIYAYIKRLERAGLHPSAPDIADGIGAAPSYVYQVLSELEKSGDVYRVTRGGAAALWRPSWPERAKLPPKPQRPTKRGALEQRIAALEERVRRLEALTNRHRRLR